MRTSLSIHWVEWVFRFHFFINLISHMSMQVYEQHLYFNFKMQSQTQAVHFSVASLLLWLLSFVAPLVCFCCSLHSTQSITWPVYYQLRVFNILNLSRNPEEEVVCFLLTAVHTIDYVTRLLPEILKLSRNSEEEEPVHLYKLVFSCSGILTLKRKLQYQTYYCCKTSASGYR